MGDLEVFKVCARCKEKIYLADKRKVKGPLREGKYYCETCWTCYECGKLIKEVDKFSTNPIDKEDLEIYCHMHNTRFATRTKPPRHLTPPPPVATRAKSAEKPTQDTPPKAVKPQSPMPQPAPSLTKAQESKPASVIEKQISQRGSQKQVSQKFSQQISPRVSQQLVSYQQTAQIPRASKTTIGESPYCTCEEKKCSIT